MRLGLLDLPVALSLPPLRSSVLEPDLVRGIKAKLSWKEAEINQLKSQHLRQKFSSCGCVEIIAILSSFNKNEKRFFFLNQDAIMKHLFL